MTILRSYQASSLLPEKIINPDQSQCISTLSTKESDEEELCEKIRETINDLDNNYASDEERGEKTRAYRKRYNTVYQPSKPLTFLLSMLVVLYIIVQIIFFPFFIQNYSILDDSEGDGVKLLFPQYNANNKNTYVGYFDREIIYSYNKATRTVDTTKSTNNIYLTWKTFLRDPGMNNILKILYLTALIFSVIAGSLFLSGLKKLKKQSLIIQVTLYVINLSIHFMLLSKPSGDRLIIQLTLSSINLFILIPLLYLTNKVITSSRRFGYYIRYPILDLISRTFSLKLDEACDDMNMNNNDKEKGKTVEEYDGDNEMNDSDKISFNEKKENDKKVLTDIIKDIDNSLEIQSARKQMKQHVDKGHKLFSIIHQKLHMIPFLEELFLKMEHFVVLLVLLLFQPL
eukprot:jgi/Orpsp1_1/1183835/evm.model.c7180000086888.1